MSGWNALWEDDAPTNSNMANNETNLSADNNSTADDSDTNITAVAPTSTPLLSPIFSPTDHYSDRDEFNELFNTTELLAMDLTLSPSPPITSSLPTLAPTNSINRGGWTWGEQPTLWNHNNNDHPTTTEEQVNFKEFIAFIAWYAFLIICCFIPTWCAYQRRRRNARILQASLNNMQRRLDELDRMGGLEQQFSSRMDPRWSSGTMEILDLGENRNRDWDFLEQLFGGGVAEQQEGEGRRRTIMSDILSGMSVRMLIDREERRKRERGSRLVAALKESSMVSIFVFDFV